MVIDSSALIAIMLGEPQRSRFERCIEVGPNRLASAAVLTKTSIVVFSRREQEGLNILRAVLTDMRIEPVPFAAAHMDLAIDAFRRSGKGRHAAGLDFGGCFSYALANGAGEPLLFRGDDLALTDMKRAV